MSKIYQYTPGASADSYSVSFTDNKAYRGEGLNLIILSIANLRARAILVYRVGVQVYNATCGLFLARVKRKC